VSQVAFRQHGPLAVPHAFAAAAVLHGYPRRTTQAKAPPLVTGSKLGSEQNPLFGPAPPATVPDAHASAPVNRK
jgi:hypothetical protein